MLWKRWFIGVHIDDFYIENVVFFDNFYYEVLQAVLNGGTKNKIVGTEQMGWIKNGFNAKFSHVWMVKRGIHVKSCYYLSGEKKNQ